jgi:dTDP-4-dehydrorhamnose reductase
MRMLITGSNGLLGQKIVAHCIKNGHEFLATSMGDNRNPHCPKQKYMSMDISNKLVVNQIFQAFYPTHVIHTAALTNVDYCEEHPDECHQINVLGTEILFASAIQYEAHFQFLSTDFVFDGEKGNYIETDQVNPLSVYATSKVKGENLILQSKYKDWSIVRTIIVYGEGEQLSRSNIVLWAKGALEKGDPLTIVDDQFRAPTWADDLAWGCLEIVRRNQSGIFHLCGPETMSILDLVNRIAVYFGYDTSQITSSKSDTLKQAAKRPPRTGFDLKKAKELLDYDPKTIEETLGQMTFN